MLSTGYIPMLTNVSHQAFLTGLHWRLLDPTVRRETSLSPSRGVTVCMKFGTDQAIGLGSDNVNSRFPSLESLREFSMSGSE